MKTVLFWIFCAVVVFSMKSNDKEFLNSPVKKIMATVTAPFVVAVNIGKKLR